MDNSTNRRQFIKSLFGLSNTNKTSLDNKDLVSGSCFVWTDLRTGQTGFPTGTALPLIQEAQAQSILKSFGISESRELNILHVIQLCASIATNGKVPALQSNDESITNNDDYPKLTSPELENLANNMSAVGHQKLNNLIDPENKLELALKHDTICNGNTFCTWVAGYFPAVAPRYAIYVQIQSLSGSDSSEKGLVVLANKHLFFTEWP